MKLNALLVAVRPLAIQAVRRRLRPSALGDRLVTGAFWSIIGAIISRGLTLLATFVVARVLGSQTYGELGMVQSTVGMFGVFAGFGLGLTATKHVAELRQRDPIRTGRILGLSSLVALVTGGTMALGLLILAPWLARGTLAAPHLSSQLRIGAVILLFSALNGAQTGTLAGFESFRIVARVNFLAGVVSFPLLIIGAIWGGLTGAVWALVVTHGCNWLFNHLAARSECARHGIPVRLQGALDELPILWQFSFPAALAGILVTPVNWACAALVVNQPNGYSEMAILNVANQWTAAILFVPTALSQIVLPLLASLNGDAHEAQYRKVLRINVLLNVGIAGIVVIPVMLLARLIMSGYGSEFLHGASTLRIFALAAVMMAANNVVGSAIAGKGRMWVGFAFNAMWAVTIIAGTVLLLRSGMGARAVASASLIAYTCHTVWQGLYLHFSSKA